MMKRSNRWRYWIPPVEGIVIWSILALAIWAIPALLENRQSAFEELVPQTEQTAFTEQVSG